MIKSLLEIQKIILDGASKAHDEFEKMTGGCWLNEYPVEYFLNVGIGKEFSIRNKNCYTIFEAKYADLTENLKAKPKGRHSAMQSSNERIDLLLYDESSNPFAIVETKRWMNDRVIDDIDRALKESRRLARNGHTIDQVHACFFTYGHSEESIQNAIEAVKFYTEKSISKIRYLWDGAHSNNGELKTYKDTEYWACEPVCVSICV